MGGVDGNVCVYKVGGSLFDWPELFSRLAELLRGERRRPLLIAGGGGAADIVRGWDRVHRLGEERSHRLAIKSLGLGETLLADGVDETTVVGDRGEAGEAWRTGRTPVLCVDRFLADEEATGSETLPHTWDVTSDSIAAWVATRWPAELTLLKSTTPGAAGEGFVDPYFGQAARRVRRVRWVNLRTGEGGDLPAGR